MCHFQTIAMRSLCVTLLFPLSQQQGGPLSTWQHLKRDMALITELLQGGVTALVLGGLRVNKQTHKQNPNQQNPRICVEFAYYHSTT